MRLYVNGKAHEVAAEADMPLLWVLRDELGLTGTKYSCGVGLCGACTVHVDGAAVRSCSVAVSDIADRKVRTIEGLSHDRSHPVQLAWLRHRVPQCGYCQPGMIMAAAALLKDNPNPSEEDIRTGVTNLCRCGTYPRVREAILAAAKEVARG